MNPLAFVPLAVLIVLGVIVGTIAKRRHRNPWLWGIAGALGFLVALVAILCFHDFAELSDADKRKSRRREWIIFAIILGLFALGVIVRVQVAR